MARRRRADDHFPTADEGPRTGKQPREDAFIAVARLHVACAAECEALFKQHQLSSATFNVLRIVRRAGAEGIPTRRIGEQLLSPVPDVTRLVDRLEKAGLLRRERCSEDRRVIWIQLTPAGDERLEQVEPEVLALFDRQLGHMSARKLKQLKALCDEARARP